MGYLRGIGVALVFLALAILGLVFLGVIQLAAEIVQVVMAIVLIIIAIILLPRYLGEKKSVKLGGYSLEKVKKWK